MTDLEYHFHSKNLKNLGYCDQGWIPLTSFDIFDGRQTDTSHLSKILLRQGKGFPSDFHYF